MTQDLHPNQPSTSDISTWDRKTEAAFTELCESSGLNLVRLRRLIDRYTETKRKPSRQELVSALKNKPRIQVRGEVLNLVNKKLYVFIKKYLAK